MLLIILAGLPMTTELEGTSKLINVKGPIKTLSPIIMFPTTTEFGPIRTLSPIPGGPLCTFSWALPAQHNNSPRSLLPIQ